jgi:hypothetical protein
MLATCTLTAALHLLQFESKWRSTVWAVNLLELSATSPTPSRSRSQSHFQHLQVSALVFKAVYT